MPFYPTVETPKMISGNVDAYYGYKSYNNARGKAITISRLEYFLRAEYFLKQIQYVIPKDENGNLTHLTLIQDGKVLDIEREIEKGLDHLTFRHRWIGDPYRFNHVNIKPIGQVQWLTPDLFYWKKGSPLSQGTQT